MRENHRLKMAVLTPAADDAQAEGFDLSFQLANDYSRVLALAQLELIERGEVFTFKFTDQNCNVKVHLGQDYKQGVRPQRCRIPFRGSGPSRC